MNIWPSTGTCAPRCGSTSVANPKPMVREILWPANTSASNVSCTTMPIDTPMSSSNTAASIPAAEKIERPAGTSTRGASKNASARVSTIFTRPGTTASPAAGAVSTKPLTRSAGHHIRPTHIDTSAAFSISGCMLLADHRRDAGVQIMREIDEHAQDPGAGGKQGEHEHQQLRDEAQGGFIDLGGCLQHADHQARDQCDEQQRRGNQRGDQQRLVSQVHDILGRH